MQLRLNVNFNASMIIWAKMEDINVQFSNPDRFDKADEQQFTTFYNVVDQGIVCIF